MSDTKFVAVVKDYEGKPWSSWVDYMYDEEFLQPGSLVVFVQSRDVNTHYFIEMQGQTPWVLDTTEIEIIGEL